MSRSPGPKDGGRADGQPFANDAVLSAASMSIAALLKGKGPNGFGYGTTASEVVAGCDLSGRTMLVTGCSSGLGLETIGALGRQTERARG